MRYILAALCILSSGTAWAETLRVPQQHDTIAAAVTAAKDGDTILISRGRYQESVATMKRLDFRGRGAIWDGYFGSQNNAQLSVTADRVTVTGIRFEHGTVPVTIVGNDAKVVQCRFRACDAGIYVDGRNAKVERNLFSGQRGGGDASIGVEGPGAVVRSNRMIYGDSGIIEVDAEGGTATLSGNTIDTMGAGGFRGSADSFIEVRNASGARVTRNVVRNAYRDGDVIALVSCDDALVSANKLTSVNYDVESGIHVSGQRAMVTRNWIENLIDYDSRVVVVEVEGNDAGVSRNKIRLCGSGEDFETTIISVVGSGAKVERNLIDDVAGGGQESRAISIEGNDGSVGNNRIGYLNDECNYGIHYEGDRGRIAKNRIVHNLYGADIRVIGNDFVIERNVLENGAFGCTGIETDGSGTSAGAAVIRGNSLRSLGDDGIDHTGDIVLIADNRLNHLAGNGIAVRGDRNTLERNTVASTYLAGFLVDGTSNTLTRCTITGSDGDGFHVEGARNFLDRCVASDCAAEGLDNSGTETNAVNCRLTGSRIDYAGNANMARDQGTTFGTGGRAVAPEID